MYRYHLLRRYISSKKYNFISPKGEALLDYFPLNNDCLARGRETVWCCANFFNAEKFGGPNRIKMLLLSDQNKRLISCLSMNPGFKMPGKKAFDVFWEGSFTFAEVLTNGSVNNFDLMRCRFPIFFDYIVTGEQNNVFCISVFFPYFSLLFCEDGREDGRRR